MPTYVTTQELQKAYLAGLFDGEGCISLRDQGSITRNLRVALGQKNWPLLESLRQQFGGTLARGGNVWILNLCSRDAIKGFLQYILPYLVIRYKEAEIALKICEMVPRQGVPQTTQEKVVRLRLESLLEQAADERSDGFMEAIQ